MKWKLKKVMMKEQSREEEGVWRELMELIETCGEQMVLCQGWGVKDEW